MSGAFSTANATFRNGFKTMRAKNTKQGKLVVAMLCAVPMFAAAGLDPLQANGARLEGD